MNYLCRFYSNFPVSLANLIKMLKTKRDTQQTTINNIEKQVFVQKKIKWQFNLNFVRFLEINSCCF